MNMIKYIWCSPKAHCLPGGRSITVSSPLRRVLLPPPLVTPATPVVMLPTCCCCCCGCWSWSTLPPAAVFIWLPSADVSSLSPCMYLLNSKQCNTPYPTQSGHSFPYLCISLFAPSIVPPPADKLSCIPDPTPAVPSEELPAAQPPPVALPPIRLHDVG